MSNVVIGDIFLETLPDHCSKRTRKFLPAEDTLDYPINIYFQEASDFIERMR